MPILTSGFNQGLFALAHEGFEVFLGLKLDSGIQVELLINPSNPTPSPSDHAKG
jgi:hypothetical protein